TNCNWNCNWNWNCGPRELAASARSTSCRLADLPGMPHSLLARTDGGLKTPTPIRVGGDRDPLSRSLPSEEGMVAGPVWEDRDFVWCQLTRQPTGSGRRCGQP